MSIEEKIRETANQFPEFSYIFEDWYSASTALSRVALPAIIAILPVNGNIKFRNGRTYDTENIAIAFVDKVPRDANAGDNSTVYNRMKIAGVEFIKALNKSGYFEPIGEEVRYEVICEKFADIVTGVFFDLQLKEGGMC